MSIRDVLRHMDGGAALLSEEKKAATKAVLAQAAIDLSASAGRSCQSAVLGVIGKKNAEGQLSVKQVQKMTGFSSS